MKLESKAPRGPLNEKWDRHRLDLSLVSPANKKKYSIIVIGTGLAGASASATLGELGYNVKTFCFQDSPRRAHSIAAQGGINAAKNYQNDGDSIRRLFYDTIKGGDFRAREANVYRLAQISNSIIDQCVAQGVPFTRDYGGQLANRSFGGAKVSRTFFVRGQTGQQLLMGAYGALSRQVAEGSVELFTRRDMRELVLIDGKARGVVVRNLVTGEIESHSADAVVLASGGYGNVYFLSTNAMGSNVSSCFSAYKKGALFANPCFTQIHPTCIPVHGDYQSKLTLMSESLRNDGRVWVPADSSDKRAPSEIPERERSYFLEEKYPGFGNLVPRDVASRNIKKQCDEGKGVSETGLAVYLDLTDAIKRDGLDAIRRKYGNLFDMYMKITGVDPSENPMMIYPASHYTMGGLWVDYNLMSNIDGLFVTGEANFSDHGANRLGASALMQGLADGYFVLPNTIGGYLEDTKIAEVNETHQEFRKAEDDVKNKIDKLMSAEGKLSCDDFHKRLGKIMWDHCGISRNISGLERASAMIGELKEEFWNNLDVPGSGKSFNQNLEKAGRVADFIEMGSLMIEDAMDRKESCGAHFNEDYQTEDNEALRDDENYSNVSAWEFTGGDSKPKVHREQLVFENVEPSRRSYK